MSVAMKRGDIHASFLLNDHHEEQRSRQEVSDSNATTIASTTPTSTKRGLSLNHLINFSFPPRQQYTGGSSAAVRKRTSSTSYHVPFNKERFINANYRFHVRPEFIYTDCLSDPDTLIDWARILHVIVPQAPPSETKCPICLEAPPAAPRMTRCGHVFCFPCVLRYLNGGKYGTCPICHDYVSLNELKATSVVEVKGVEKGQLLDLALVKRGVVSQFVCVIFLSLLSN